jgi:hypothetical protein
LSAEARYCPRSSAGKAWVSPGGPIGPDGP